MTQYLLSVHMVEGEPLPSDEVMAQMYKDVDVFNEELKAKGAWVFAGGLHPSDTATVVRVKDGEVLTTDGPFAETKEAISPTPVVAPNRAVAVGEVHGPAAALDAVDHLDLDGYHLFHAARADLLRRLGRHDAAAEAYDAALALVGNAAERRFLEDRRRALSGLSR